MCKGMSELLINSRAPGILGWLRSALLQLRAHDDSKFALKATARQPHPTLISIAKKSLVQRVYTRHNHVSCHLITAKTPIASAREAALNPAWAIVNLKARKFIIVGTKGDGAGLVYQETHHGYHRGSSKKRSKHMLRRLQYTGPKQANQSPKFYRFGTYLAQVKPLAGH